MLHGRRAECATIDRLLADARTLHSGALVIRGAAGVGKTALLAYAGGHTKDMTVLRSAGVEAESELAFAALHQLVRPVLDRVGTLPNRQAAALRAAFGMAELDLDPAETADLVEVEGRRLTFRHPLVRSAIYQSATFTRRRAAQLERAAELTAPATQRARRLKAAAEAAWLAGLSDRARALLERAAPLASEPRLRSDLEHLRGSIELGSGTPADAAAVLLAGSELVTALDPQKAARC